MAPTDKETDTNWIARHIGEVRTTDRGFAFLEPQNVFILPPLARKCACGQLASVTAIRTVNKKRRTLGWKALDIEPVAPGAMDRDES